MVKVSSGLLAVAVLVRSSPRVASRTRPVSVVCLLNTLSDYLSLSISNLEVSIDPNNIQMLTVSYPAQLR